MPEMFYAEAIWSALYEEMKRDGSVFLMGEDIGLLGSVFGVTRGFLKEFGEERVRSTPISEAGFTGAAVGAAIMGLRPVVEIMYVDFITLAMDQIINQAAKLRYLHGGKIGVPLVIRTQGGGGRGNAAQHSQSLEALFCNVPGLKVVMPATPYDAKGLLKTAIRCDDPVVVLEHKLLYGVKGEVPPGDYTVPFGQACIKRAGTDATVVATSRMVWFALQAAEELEKEGIQVEVIDPRSLVPLDVNTLCDSAKKTGRVLVVHESHKGYGIGAELACTISEFVFKFLKAPVLRLGALDVPIPYNTKLEEYVLVGKEDIVEQVRNLVRM